MALQSKIEWTEATWNPVTGCTKISAGCANCYAERLAKRLKAMGNRRYRNGFRLTLHPDLLDAPLHWRQPRIVFVNSMSDLFHEEVPFNFIEHVFATMREAEQHIFQVLTKRSQRLAEVASDLPWPDNVWAGVTVEHQDYLSRIRDLLTVPASVRFLSLEPLLGPLKELPLRGVQWVIVGGESGPGARPMDSSWVRSIRAQCLARGVPFFFKQWGGFHRKAAGRSLDGRIWEQMPGESALSEREASAFG